MSAKQKIFSVLRRCVPPIITDALKKTPLYRPLLSMQNRFILEVSKPSWHTIKDGPLSGIRIYSPNKGGFGEMISGNYDKFFSDYIAKLPLEGKTVFDIGAHIGFSSLVFAKAVGKKGKVYAFEPNRPNAERLKKILSENQELGKRVTLEEIAISDKPGKEEFVFGDQVDEGTSSGSFISSANTIWEKGIYDEIGFKRAIVETASLDSLSNTRNISDAPAVIKIDVEGAEYLVIRGAKKFLKKNRSIILMEIHSIFNMLETTEGLREAGYGIELLSQESDGRCFIAATPEK